MFVVIFICNVLKIVVCPFFLWPLSCLSVEIRLLITPLVSSNFSYGKILQYVFSLAVQKKLVHIVSNGVHIICCVWNN